MVKNLPANSGDPRDLGSTPGSAKSPGVGNRFNNLAWKIPWTEVGYIIWGRKELGTTERACARAHTHTHTHTHFSEFSMQEISVAFKNKILNFLS